MSGAAKPSAFKYPAEDECLVRRLGSAVVVLWDTLLPEQREKIQAEAALVWDREFGVAQLPQKLAALIKKHQSKR
jgi:hypothetical protein